MNITVKWIEQIAEVTAKIILMLADWTDAKIHL